MCLNVGFDTLLQIARNKETFCPKAQQRPTTKNYSSNYSKWILANHGEAEYELFHNKPNFSGLRAYKCLFVFEMLWHSFQAVYQTALDRVLNKLEHFTDIHTHTHIRTYAIEMASGIIRCKLIE